MPLDLIKYRNNDHGCKYCCYEDKYNLLTQSEYIDRLIAIDSTLIPLDKYKNIFTKINHYCKVHNKKHLISPIHALRGQGCDECKSDKIGNAKRKSVSDYIKQLKIVTKTIILNGEYISGNVQTPHKCLICGHEWNPFPSNLLKGYGCPICDCSSHGEKAIREILNEFNIDYIEQYRFSNCKLKRTLPFDFYLPNINVCIEYQGVQHFKPVCFGGINIDEATKNYESLKIRDKIKNEYCSNNEILLLEISYKDFNNIRRIIADLKGGE